MTSHAALPPSQTLYIKNLDDKMGIDALKRNLHALFTPYGRLLDIVALKRNKMRGQAHVVFESIEGAAKGLRGLNNFPFFGRPLKISYARTPSRAVTLHLGRYLTSSEITALNKKKPSTVTTTNGPTTVSVPAKRAAEEEADGAAKRRKEEEEEGSDMETEDVEERKEEEKPNRILFVSGLPSEVTDEMLSLLFSQYPGFKEVRLVPGKNDIAFIEFDTEQASSSAKNVLDGFKLTPRDRMSVGFARVGS